MERRGRRSPRLRVDRRVCEMLIREPLPCLIADPVRDSDQHSLERCGSILWKNLRSVSSLLFTRPSWFPVNNARRVQTGGKNRASGDTELWHEWVEFIPFASAKGYRFLGQLSWFCPTLSTDRSSSPPLLRSADNPADNFASPSSLYAVHHTPSPSIFQVPRTYTQGSILTLTTYSWSQVPWQTEILSRSPSCLSLEQTPNHANHQVRRCNNKHT